MIKKQLKTENDSCLLQPTVVLHTFFTCNLLKWPRYHFHLSAGCDKFTQRVVLFDNLVNYCIILKPKLIFRSIIGWSFRFIRWPLVLFLRLETTGVWQWWIYGSLNWPEPSLLYKQSAAPPEPKCFMSTQYHLIRRPGLDQLVQGKTQKAHEKNLWSKT